MDETTNSNSTWETSENITPLRNLKSRSKEPIPGIHTILQEIEIKQKQSEQVIEKQKILRFKKPKSESDKIQSLTIFIEKAIEKKKESIKDMYDFKIEFDEYNGLFIVSYYFDRDLTLEDERKIAELEVLILEKIDIFRIDFQRIYKR
ncbi:MAG: hypothetical protein K9W46_04425 [Candidatus Heimdallarchaeum endolithica]|uniref:Uncharacterized protein n=1 Tax=Candidatus Heimdallarchaeum endolithica TaxID=2876572 RepID=A0A9Y1BSV6_9ARCH|nr:MAG: hypothetical protein K9W46_04425 [Candidatus Heimdallarchaeum endolithica]